MLLSHLLLLLRHPFSNSFCMARLHPIDRSLVTDYMHEFFDSLLTSFLWSRVRRLRLLEKKEPSTNRSHDDESPTYLTKNANRRASKSSSITTHSDQIALRYRISSGKVALLASLPL